MAFISAPAAFPIRGEDRHIQKYLKWKPRINNQAIKFIKDKLPRPFVGIHLRNNLDWENVCKTIRDGNRLNQLFASPQCLGYYNEHGLLTPQICDPSPEVILQNVEDVVASLGAKSIFVASDRDHMITDLNDRLANRGVKAHRLESDDTFVDLAILSLSDHFIGNCISTFSSFVSRTREYGSRKDLKATSFFGYEPEQKRKIEL